MRCKAVVVDPKTGRNRKCKKIEVDGNYCHIHSEKNTMNNAGVTNDMNNTYGVCCFCGDYCNACSQACGRCMRNGIRF